MKKAALITITQQENFGNRLQNYAVQEFMKKNGIECYTVHNHHIKPIGFKNILFCFVKKLLKKIIYIKKEFRRHKFAEFDKKYINFGDVHIYNNFIPNNIENDFDYFICGSDQIWNLNYDSNSVVNFLEFVKNKPKISFAASFGSDSVPDNKINITKKRLKSIRYLSVREETGKKIIKNICNRDDVEVLVDPTMLLSAKEWDLVSIKPKNVSSNEKYLLCYFLGEFTDKYYDEIKKVAEKKGWKIINILDKNNYIKYGPSEFLYLEKNAQLICTDSFHSCVFAIIFNRPFVIFDRIQKNLVSMNSRIDTLLNIFNLNERKYNGEITLKQLNCNYSSVDKILKFEKKKSIEFVKKIIEENG